MTVRSPRRSRFPALGLAAVAALVLASGSSAQTDPRIDGNGRDAAVFPPSVLFDPSHMRLEFHIPSMSEPKAHGRLTLSLAAVGIPRDTITLNAEEMVIRGVSWGRKPLAFTHDGKLLRITLPKPAKPGEPLDIVIEYDVEYAVADGAGLTWTPGREDAESETNRAPQIHSQGQPEANRTWFPTHDFPNDRLSSELIVTTEDGYEVCSNGALISREVLGDGQVRWHWKQELNHPAYLVVLVVGKFDLVDIGAASTARPGLPMVVYATKGTSEHIAHSFGRTPDMVAHFEKLFDEPFPWDKYHQLIVRNFSAGAMENTSATTFHPSFAEAPREAAEGTIAHELVHQWFGDLIGYDGWEHLWLGEGWASFGEALWNEAAASPENRRRAYQRGMAGFFQRQRGSNRTTAPGAPAMASCYYSSPDSTFFKPNDVYSKGALVLHMLRMRLGDDAFFRGTALYIDRCKFTQADSDDFRYALEAVSGESLERFFDQWVFRPGMPRLDAKVTWDASTSSLKVSLKQTQTINADNPAYALEVPLYLTWDGRDPEWRYIRMETRETEASFPLSGVPTDVVVDPNFSSGAPVRLEKTLAMWIEQLERSDSYFARIQAAERLGEADVRDLPEVRSALSRAVALRDGLLTAVALDSLTATGTTAAR